MCFKSGIESLKFSKLQSFHALAFCLTTVSETGD